MTKRTPYIYTNTTTGATSANTGWIDLNNRFSDDKGHGFYITTGSASNQTVDIQVSPSVLTSASDTPTEFFTVSSFANFTSASGTLDGGWPSVRVVVQGNDSFKFVLMR